MNDLSSGLLTKVSNFLNSPLKIVQGEDAWTKWLWFGLFVVPAGLLIWATTPATVGLSFFAKFLQTYLPMVEILLLAIFGFMDLVKKSDPGSIDSKPIDRWSIVHCGAGVVMGLYAVPFLVVVLLTVLWELFEMLVPGFGDTEIAANRITDLTLAWAGWFVFRLIVTTF
jgi:hypothetical protein